MFILEFKKSVKKDLKNIGEFESIRILKAIKEKLLPDPQIGKRLKGNDGELWSFRTGNYRVLYNIDLERSVVLILRISHRREVYKSID